MVIVISLENLVTIQRFANWVYYTIIDFNEVDI